MGGREEPLPGIVIGEPITIDDSFYRRYQAAEGTPKGGLSLSDLSDELAVCETRRG